jgi:hypothetical protein
MNSDTQHIINRCSKVERPFLYIMVFITMISSCENGDKLTALKSKIDSISSRITVLERPQ